MLAGNSHWICVANDGSGNINVYDSLASIMGLSVPTILQLGKLYSMPANHSALTVKRQSVQQQAGCVDCGLFSIAYAVEACLGQNPENACFSQESMRAHLFFCLSKGIVQPFPRMLHVQESLARPKRGVLLVDVFCFCKMPAQYDTDMIECETCKCWYHCCCVKLDPSNLPDHWECPQCL